MAESVKVSVRVRPFNQRELSAGSTQAVSCSGPTVIVTGACYRTFTYDKTYLSTDPEHKNFASQEDVVTGVGDPLLNGALNGFNGCVFAYGQTGSGKSYSVFGNSDTPGLIPHVVEKLFAEKKRLEQDCLKELRVWVSYLEIYNEHLHDLLHVGFGKSEKEEHNLKVHEHPQLGIYVPGLEVVPCETQKKVQKLLDFGAKKRAVAATQMNAHSSRSHAVVTLKVHLLSGPKPKSGEQESRRELHAKFNLIDLAGSERQSRSHSEGETFREACAINKSLSALGLVIKELSEDQAIRPRSKTNPSSMDQSLSTKSAPAPDRAISHSGSTDARQDSKKRTFSYNTAVTMGTSLRVPFRASKLTFLLKDSLAGNSKTHMLAAISPGSDSLDETVSTLRFASSVKEIQTLAVQNETKRDDVIDNLRSELEVLRNRLSENNHTEKEKVLEQERLIAEMMKGYEAQLDHANNMDKMRESALEDMALTQDEISSVFGVDKMTPYLLNLSDDPILAGTLLFYIATGQRRDIGSAEDNAIRLCGIGISERLCVIENTENTLTIWKCGPEGRVVVAGKPLEEGVPKQLRHGQRIFLGRAFAMKVSIPSDAEHQEGSPPAPVSPGIPEQEVKRKPRKCSTADFGNTDLLLEGLEEEWASLDTSRSWCNLSDQVRNYAQQMPAYQATALWNEVKKAVMACDEANDITDECRPGDGLQFEVDLTSALRMSVVVRVLRNPLSGTGDDCQQLYIWSVGQMMERLDRMKDCYNTFKRVGSFEVDPLQDPWHETQSATIWHHITHLEKEYYAVQLDNNRLRGREQNLVAKTLLFFQDGNEPQMVKLVFLSWRQCSKGKGRHSIFRNPLARSDSKESQQDLESASPAKPRDQAPEDSTQKAAAGETLARAKRISRKPTFQVDQVDQDEEVDPLALRRRTQGEAEAPPAEAPPGRKPKGQAPGRLTLLEHEVKAIMSQITQEPSAEPESVSETKQEPGKALPAASKMVELKQRQTAADADAEDAEPRAAAEQGMQTQEGQFTLRQAFEQLRGELFEQRLEATRLRSNRSQLHDALDRFEKMLTALMPGKDDVEPHAVGGWADAPWPTYSSSLPPTAPAGYSTAVFVSPPLVHAKPVPLCLSKFSGQTPPGPVILTQPSHTISSPGCVRRILSRETSTVHCENGAQIAPAPIVVELTDRKMPPPTPMMASETRIPTTASPIIRYRTQRLSNASTLSDLSRAGSPRLTTRSPPRVCRSPMQTPRVLAPEILSPRSSADGPPVAQALPMASAMVTGVDRNRDGIPDFLQQQLSPQLSARSSPQLQSPCTSPGVPAAILVPNCMGSIEAPRQQRISFSAIAKNALSAAPVKTSRSPPQWAAPRSPRLVA